MYDTDWDFNGSSTVLQMLEDAQNINHVVDNGLDPFLIECLLEFMKIHHILLQQESHIGLHLQISQLGEVETVEHLIDSPVKFMLWIPHCCLDLEKIGEDADDLPER